MWGPLKDTGRKGGIQCAQASGKATACLSPHPALCTKARRGILWSAPTLFLSSLFLSPRCRPPLPPRPRLTFLAAASCMGAFPEQEQICLVCCHFLSLDPIPPPFFYHVWKLNREAIVGRRMFSLFCLCFVTLCFASYLLCIACPPPLARSQYDSDETFFVFPSCPLFKRLFGSFLRFRLSGLIVFILGCCPDWYILGLWCGAEGPEHCPQWTGKEKWPDNHRGCCCRRSRNMTALHLTLHFQSLLTWKCLKML